MAPANTLMRAIVLLTAYAAAFVPSAFRMPSFNVGENASSINRILNSPPDVYSENGELYYEIDFTVCQYDGPYTSFTTRCFNEMMVSHTLHVYPGDVVTIKMTNLLLDKDTHVRNNAWQLLNTTNLHFHGGHISADPPGDDVLEKIDPWSGMEGDEPNSFTYIYHIPPYHTPGLGWYHPHPHGAAALQTGTAAIGMIVIHEIPGSTPTFITDLEDILLAVNFVSIDDLLGWGAQGCINQEIFVPTPEGAIGSYLDFGICYDASTFQFIGRGAQCAMNEFRFGQGIALVNGMTQPRIPMIKGKWYRMRILTASVLYSFHGDLPTECEWKLLSKDTVPILEDIRDVTAIWLFPGSRAEFAVRCNEAGQIPLVSQYIQQEAAYFEHTPPFVGPLFTMDVVDDGSPADGPMIQYSTNRPCYVIDTRSVIHDPIKTTPKYLIFSELDTFSPGPNAPVAPPSDGPVRKLVEERRLADGEDDEFYNNFCVDGQEPNSVDQGVLSAFFPNVSYVPCAQDPITGLYPPFPLCVCPFAKFCLPGVVGHCFSCDLIADEVANVYGINGCSFLSKGTERMGFDFTQGGRIQLPPDVPSFIDFEGTVGESCENLVLSDGYLPVGSLMEWTTYGAHLHPIHFHVNPYQWVATDFTFSELAGIGTAEDFKQYTGNFYEEGDFGDSMMIPNQVNVFHQQLDQFATKMVLHCHILPHEDWGMMMVFDIEGETGSAESHYSFAKEIDPTCYLDPAEATYEITEECQSDEDCPTGWSCPMAVKRRNLKFGYSDGRYCVEGR